MQWFDNWSLLWGYKSRTIAIVLKETIVLKSNYLSIFQFPRQIRLLDIAHFAGMCSAAINSTLRIAIVIRVNTVFFPIVFLAVSFMS